MPKARFIFRKCFYSSFLVVSVALLVDVASALAAFFCAALLVVVDLAAVRLLVVPAEAFLVVLDDAGADLVVLALRAREVEEAVEDDFVDVLLVACVDFDEVFLGAAVLLAALLASAFLAASFAAKRATCSTSKSTFALNSSSCCSFCWRFWPPENAEKSGVDATNF